MKKVLLYNLYINDFISDNKNYLIHKECLKYYKNIFDEMIFYVSYDEYVNEYMINDAIYFINDVCSDKEYSIKIRKNTYLCESENFKYELIDNREFYKDSLVFIAHSKNVSRLGKNLELLSPPGHNGSDVIPESIIKWCIALYFYSLNFIKECEGKLLGMPCESDLFYGSMLMQFKSEHFGSISINKSLENYAGSFYWINMAKFNNIISSKKLVLPNVDDRYYFEKLPGNICNRSAYGGGMSSHKDVWLTDGFDLYKMNVDEWNYLIEVLKDSDEFWTFYNNIMSKIENN